VNYVRCFPLWRVLARAPPPRKCRTASDSSFVLGSVTMAAAAAKSALVRKRSRSEHRDHKRDLNSRLFFLIQFPTRIRAGYRKSAIATILTHSLASTRRFSGVTDSLLSLFVRVPELCPVARFFSSGQTVKPGREEPNFHAGESKARG
jgi:hypothetical protein